MASSPKFACLFFFLFTTLVFSPRTHARDSEFFNKQTPKINTHEPPLKKNEVEEEPSFLPQTSGTGYGLYGHETGLDPPTTTDNNNNNDDNEAISHHDQKNYVTELKGLSVNGFLDDIPRKSNNYYNKNNNGGEKKYDYNYNYYGGAGYNGGMEKQGMMSDPRVFENGKYSYDIDAEKNRFDHYNHHYQANYKSYPRNYNNNYYHKDGYFGHGNNNYGEYYNNKYYNNGNDMHQGYQNQMHEEEEFDFDP